MKAVNVDDVLRILHKYGKYIFVTDEKKFFDMVDEIANLPSMVDTMLDKIRAEILEERECAYADFDKYKVDYLGVDSRYVEDELPYDDFRYGMERCIEIIDKYKARK